MDSEGDARSLARVLNRGAFPVNVEAQTVQTVSPTLGQDSLQASVIAGIGRRGARAAVPRRLLPPAHVAHRRRHDRVGHVDLQRGGDRLADHQLRPHARRCDGHHRVDRSHRRQLRRVLRAAQGRGAPWAHDQELRRPSVQGELADDRGRRPRRRSSPPPCCSSSASARCAASPSTSASPRSATCIVFFCFTRPAVALLAGSGRLDRRDTFGLGSRE